VGEGGNKKAKERKIYIYIYREREREGGTERTSNPNEYLISAYLTPGKVQSDGMVGTLPGGWKEEPRVPCTSQQPRDIG